MRTLRHAVERGKVHHAYLFVGSRGTGKTSMAKILAACLNCERGPTVEPCGVCESCLSIAAATSLDVIEMDAASQQLGRRHPRPARERGLRPGLRPPQGVHPRRGAHALAAGVERVPQDARGAAAEHDLRARHDRGPEGAADGGRPLPPLRLRPARRSQQIAIVLRRIADAEGIEMPDAALALVARSATGSFRDALGTLEQLVDLQRRRGGSAAIAIEDVLAVLGVADAELLFEHGRRRRRRRRAAPRCAPPPGWPRPGATSTRFLGDLEAHAREPADRADARGGARRAARHPRAGRAPGRRRPSALAAPDVVRLLDLVAAAFEAIKDGAERPRSSSSSALVKAAGARGRPVRRGPARPDRAAGGARSAGAAPRGPAGVRRRRATATGRRRPRARPPRSRRPPAPPRPWAAAPPPSRPSPSGPTGAGRGAGARGDPRPRPEAPSRARAGRGAADRPDLTAMRAELWPAVARDRPGRRTRCSPRCFTGARPVAVRDDAADGRLRARGRLPQRARPSSADHRDDRRAGGAHRDGPPAARSPMSRPVTAPGDEVEPADPRSPRRSWCALRGRSSTPRRCPTTTKGDGA